MVCLDQIWCQVQEQILESAIFWHVTMCTVTIRVLQCRQHDSKHVALCVSIAEVQDGQVLFDALSFCCTYPETVSAYRMVKQSMFVKMSCHKLRRD